ncbi:MAG TPA: carboxylating nicotinate-nucleotide diphosphorylase [Vicinamibacteria bacterium]|nr:carboxylating nicotinate-nucleotide diphosphorylase [Vicinamibacteria bacterium]
MSGRIEPWAILDIDPERVRRIVRLAVEEDVGARDATTEATVDADARATGVFVARQPLLIAGLDVALEVFRVVDPKIEWETRAREGDRFDAGNAIASVTGLARGILAGERVALNFLQRMSGIATLTRRFVDAVAGTRAKIRDTRKTTPLLRLLEKRAVLVGGGTPHRSGLDSAILVKDNHVRMAGSVGEATRRAVAAAGDLDVEIEVDRPDQIDEALAAGAQMILLDNFTPEQAAAAVKRIAGRVPVEVSGGIRLENVRAYAEAGPDYIAVGALTHSAPAVDIALDIERVE